MVAVTILAATILVGCASAPPPAESGDDRTNVPIYRQTSNYAPTAQVIGRLAIEDGCLVLHGRDGITRGVAWRSGAQWDEATQQITLDGVVARVGDDVALDGGEYAAPAGGGPDQWVAPPSGGCLDPELYWRASSIASVE